MKNKIITIIIIIVALLFVGFLVAIGVNKYLNRGKVFVDGLIITDVEIKKDGNFYDYSATITAKEAKKVKSIDITFFDENDKKIIKVNNIVNRDLKVKDEFKINAKTDLNIKDAKRIEYKIN